VRNYDLLLFGIAFLLSAGITGLMKAYAQRANLLDLPNQRSSHKVATPRGGGLGIVVVFLSVVFALWLLGDIEKGTAIAFVLGGGMVAGIGFADDHSDVPAGWRFLVQIIAATMVVTMLGGLAEFQLGKLVVDLGIAGDLLAVVFMVWFTNAFNFMDGIDGIAASEAICIAGGGLIILSLGEGGAASSLLAAIGASSLGFLAWNWPPAKIFLGDVGSAFLGFVLMAIAFLTSGDGSVSIWSWLILLGVFFVDATVTLVTRMLKREDWLSAHRNHAYQKASRHYGSHGRVTIGAITINLVWLFPIAFLATAKPERGWWLTLAAWAPLIVFSLWIGAGRSND
jgi:Fuc2NAc and GlcNAc transferase